MILVGLGILARRRRRRAATCLGALLATTAVRVAAGPGGLVVVLNGAIPLKVDVEPGVLRPGDEVTIGIRPEGLSADPGGVLAGIARVVEGAPALTRTVANETAVPARSHSNAVST